MRMNSAQRRGVDLGVAHSLSQWQSCMWAGTYLNQLLCFPLSEPRCAWLFSGTLLHGLEAALRGGHQAESLLAGAPVALQLYSTLLGAIQGSVFQNQSAQHNAPFPAAGPSRQRGQGRGQGRGQRGTGGRGRHNRRGEGHAGGLYNRFGMLTCEDELDQY
ncbi:protein asteroid homolog 1-like [Ictalurus furcatus]|uniref:protein asteroid homolog 1-like n=1 Tax=Ictalurus furcatus TaxID=66913 RepID=UPI0023502D0A|nr:protein asteroid homolog 1-like [Ictalurus furcatus]